MTTQHAAMLTQWSERYKDIGLRFIEQQPGVYQAQYDGLEFPPYKFTLNLNTHVGHVESGGDYEFNYNGHTTYGTMWDQDESDRYHGTLAFEQWVTHYLDRMAKVVRGSTNTALRWVSGTR